MLNEALSYLLYLYSFLYHAIVPCSLPEQLGTSTIDQQQYLGKWYFIAAVSHREADIKDFKVLDNIRFNMEKTVNDTLLLTGHIRIGDNCVKKTWTYRERPEWDDLELEGRTERKNLLFNGTWANCPECIIFQEVEPPLSPADTTDSLNRLMLYARQKDVSPGVVKAFMKNAACNNMFASMKLPQEKEFCS